MGVGIGSTGWNSKEHQKGALAMDPIQQWLKEHFDCVESGWPDSRSWKFSRYVPKHGNIPPCPDEETVFSRRTMTAAVAATVSLLGAVTFWFLR